jgi:predicted transcriptional regulator/transcriptional regulator with XRE-family HTH domain
MAHDSGVDLKVLGQRLRHVRRERDLTLDALGKRVGRPASYLSQVENGHREPRLSLIHELAAVLGCEAGDLLDPRPPNRRAELEVALAAIQEDPRFAGLKLPYVRPSARLDDAVLEHLVGVWEHLRATEERRSDPTPPTGVPAGGGETSSARQANAAMRDEMRQRDNYFEDIEITIGKALDAIGYHGPGAVSERNLTDLAAWFGFTVARVQDLPPSARSISDTRNRIIYVPQRNNATTRTARSVIAQTIGHFALGHHDPVDFGEYVRQRVEANYFAGALLAPERAVVTVLGDAKERGDISVEDLNEVFYISYEMAAHRLTNLITRHFDIPIHFQRSDPEGLLWKAYENDGVLLPADADGTIEGQRVCRWWSARQAFESEDSYSLHYQYTSTAAGTFWCVTHIEVEGGRGDAVTVGTTEEHAHWFRGSETTRRATSRCPDPTCCRQPPLEAVRRWEGVAWPSARDHSHFVSGLPTDTVMFSPFPGVDMTDVYSFLDRHPGPGGPPAS